jgi:CheY-like chemotaxis protein
VDRRIYNDPRYKKPRVKREAPSVYSTEDAAQVQHMLSRLGHRPQCPVCQGRFTLGPVDRRGIESVRQVWCADCGRGTVVTDCVLARVMILTLIDAVRTLLRVTLDGAGHEVVEPPHAKDAMEVYREHPADVVIIDASALGEAGGREFIRLLRHEVDDPRIIVLAGRPGYGQADPSVAARQLGATRVVRMPCSREDLLVAVREVRP